MWTYFFNFLICSSDDCSELSGASLEKKSLVCYFNLDYIAISTDTSKILLYQGHMLRYHKRLCYKNPLKVRCINSKDFKQRLNPSDKSFIYIRNKRGSNTGPSGISDNGRCMSNDFNP